MSPFSFLIFQEVSAGNRSVFSSSSNLNSPTPQEQSGNIVGAEEEVGTKDGIEVGLMDGADEYDGIKETDGAAEGIRLTQPILILF